MNWAGPEWSWAAISLALAAAFLIGLAKGGLVGIGTLATPLLALAVGPVKAAGVLLPVLIAQDAISVWAYRRDWDKGMVAYMLPGALLGIATGWAAARVLPVPAVMGILGFVSILFGGWRIWSSKHPNTDVGPVMPGWLAPLFGYFCGLTSQIAHSGAPPFQIWATHRRLKPTTFAGTSAILFASVNLAKVPAYYSLGQFSRDNLFVALALLPIATIGAFIAITAIRRIASERFYMFANIMLILLGVMLVSEALG